MLDTLQNDFVLFLLNINRFKGINDYLGFAIGDDFLCEVAKRLQKLCGTTSYLYRIHNDGFTVVTKVVAQLEQLAEQLLYCFDESFLIEGHTFYASASIGITKSEPDDTILSLLKRADSALKQAKAAKGNQFSLYEETLDAGISHTLFFETKIRDAIKYERFKLYYQPKFNIHKNKFDGMEALIRWQDAEQGFIAPAQFIPFAEEYGLIVKIDEWVLRTAMQ